MYIYEKYSSISILKKQSELQEETPKNDWVLTSSIYLSFSSQSDAFTLRVTGVLSYLSIIPRQETQ